jgi:hypothetical protein
VYVCLLNVINPIYVQKLREMFPPHSQNTMAICNPVTLLVLYYINSRLVTLLRVTDIFNLSVYFKFIDFSFQIFLLVPEMSNSFASYSVKIIYAYIAMVWIL